MKLRAFTALGLLFLGMSLYGFYKQLLRKDAGQLVFDELTSESTSGSSAPARCASQLISRVTLEVHAPTDTYLDDSAVIQVDATLDSSAPSDATGEIDVKLTGAGLQIVPSEGRHITLTKSMTNASAPWTVRGEKSGHYEMFLESDGNFPCQTLTIYPSGPIHLSLNIHRRWYDSLDYAKDSWPIVSGFFGTFLTLPGLIAFFRKPQNGSQD